MAETASPSAGGDKGPKEEQLSIRQPAGDVEMEDLSNVQPKPANPDEPPPPPASPLPSPQQHSDAVDRLSVVIPGPALGSLSNSRSEDEGEGEDKGEGEQSPSGKAQGKAPATATATTAPGESADLTIDPVDATAGAEAGPSSDAADISVEIMLLLTSGARHPFRIDEKYLHKRNVTVTGKTEDGKTDPSSITVYTLKELILRDWRKEWEQPPREPSAIRLIHFGRMLEDRMPLNREFFLSILYSFVSLSFPEIDADNAFPI